MTKHFINLNNSFANDAEIKKLLKNAQKSLTKNPLY